MKAGIPSNPGKLNFKQISTSELLSYAEDQGTVIIDVRPVEAYNGWRLRHELRGGHIRGARSLPLKWAGYIDWIEIVRSKGILPERLLIIYGYAPEEALQVAELKLFRPS